MSALNNLLVQEGTNLLWTCLLLCMFVYSWQWHFSRKHLYALAEKIPKPTRLTQLPFIGHTLHFVGGTERIMTTLIKMAMDTNLDIIKVWFGPVLFVIVSKAEDVEIVFNSQHAIEKHYVYKFGKFFIGDGILTAPAPIWKKHRKLILPTFNQQILNGFLPIFVEASNQMVEIFDKGAREYTEVSKWIGNCTLDMVCESVMGLKVHAQVKETKIVHAALRILELISMRIFNPLLYLNFIYKFTPNYREEKELTDYFTEFALKVIRDRKRKVEERHGDINEGGRKVLLDLLLEPKREEDRFTDLELKDEVATFIIAGIDTSANVTGFTLTLLALHPEIQDKVYEEVISILGPDRDIQIEDLSKFVYLERVIKESMRILPIAVIVARQIEEDIQLQSCTLPKGCGAAIFTWSTHRNPKYYPNPEKFDPDRFLPEEVAKRHPYTYYPFTAGLRKCTGPRYAMMAVTTMVATLVRKFVIETKYKSIEDIRLKETLVLRPVNGFLLRVKDRHTH